MSKIWLALAAAVTISPASAVTYRELQAMIDGPWRAAAPPAKSARLGQDQSRCRLIALQTPINSTTPAVVEMVRWAAEINCMQALGYETHGNIVPENKNR